MRRFIIALPFAVVISYCLVGIMVWIVDLNATAQQAKSEPLRFDIFMQEVEESSQRKSRTLPPPPEETMQPPEKALVQPEPKASIETPALEPILDIKLDVSVAEMNLAVSIPTSTPAPVSDVLTPVQGTELSNAGEIKQLTPIKRSVPVYPRKALQRRIEGFVLLSFDIDRQGKPTNIKIEDAQPRNIFNREALKALRKWSYTPLVINGEAQERTGQQVKLEFKIQ